MTTADPDGLYRRFEDDRRAVALARLRPHDLRGRNLRYCLLTVLADAREPCTIAALLGRLDRLGLRVGGTDPHKVVSDALRYEDRLGRVRRVRRGVYASGYRPDTTVRRHRDRLRDLIAVSTRELSDP
jgi:hypothetical protein